MAKISTLPLLTAPTGTETVPVLDGDVTRRAPLRPLAEAAMAPALARADAAIAQAEGHVAALGVLATDARIDRVVEGPVEALTDEAGSVVRASFASGRFVTPHFDTGQFFNPRTRLIGPARRNALHHVLALIHFLGWGQSQMGAGNAIYASPRVDPRDFTFSSGITSVGPSDTFAPMPVIGNAQIMWAAMAQLKFLIAADHGYADDYRLFASTSFQNGTPIAQLSKGTDTYTRLMAQVANAARLSDTAGYVHRVGGFCGFQGNADVNTPTATYRAALRQLMTDVKADVRSRTGQLSLPFLFIQDADQQTDYAAGQSYQPTAAAALYDLVKAGELMIACPAYHVEYSDDRHMTGNGYAQLGQHLGRALYEAVYRGSAWTGLRPREVIRYRSNKVLLRFHVPVAPLVFRTDIVIDPGQGGFRFVDDQGGTAIVDRQIVGPEEVLLTLGRDMAGNPEVRYAWDTTGGTASGPKTGPRGCLFDSDTTQGYYINSDAPWDLANPCVRFKEAVL
ncbi:sialate O-acetylesterase [Sphingomonas sp.]|uniref:sialate O-acetylesterase n=1 Tax=Sphingomonas sp. TaxID=28214 RepID=UPI000DBBE059|nr:sialate O-acetylesterase [Sphingomonas sp.]PZT91661.1 MAG: hypothetical protein DI625_15155 [Sphingomonas sp.]